MGLARTSYPIETKTRQHRWQSTIAIASVTLFLVASIMRSNGVFSQEIYLIQEALGGDYATHFWMGVVFTLAGYQLSSEKSIVANLRTAAIVFLLLILEEISQIGLKSREFSWTDIGMGAFGMAAAIGALAVKFGVFPSYPEHRKATWKAQK